MKFRDLSGALRILVGAFVGITLYANFGPMPDPVYRNVQVPVERIVEVERIDTVVTFVEKVRYVHVPATQIATAPDAGQPDVDTFCAEAVKQAVDAALPSVGADTEASDVATPAPALLLRSVRHDDGWFFARDRLILTGPTSSGDLRQMHYSVRDGFEARTHADSVIVRYPRSALLKQGVEYGIVAVIGAFVGQVVF